MILSQANEWAPIFWVVPVTSNTQGFSESISPVLSCQRAGPPPFTGPVCLLPPFSAWEKTQNSSKMAWQPSSRNQTDGQKQTVIASSTSALRYSSWSWEVVVSEGYFVSALKSLQVGIFSPHNQIWRNVKTKAALLYSGFLCLSFPFSITTTPRKALMPGLLHHTSCWRMRGQGPKREVSLE